ncbi:HlyD family secretion protein [Planctomycetota bacterium]
MAKKRRIQTPISQHWNHFRTSLLPLISFILCIWVTMFLWERRATQGTISAEAEATSVEVATGVRGNLVDLQNKEEGWQVWDEVVKGDILAQLDTRLLDKEIEVVIGETDKFIADLEATQLRTEVDLIGIKQGYKRDTNNRYNQYVDLALQEARIEVEILVDRRERERIKGNLDIQRPAFEKKAVPEAIIVDLNNQLRVVDERIKRNLYLRKNIIAKKKAAEQNWDEFKGPLGGLPELDSMRESLMTAREAQKAKIELLTLQIENMTIRSPVDGKIEVIHKRPSEAIVEGDAVMTIASDEAEFVIGYWRENHFERPTETMAVGVRLPQPDGVEYPAAIEEIGPQYILVPEHQLKDFGRREYGVPIKVRIPSELQGKVRPGQLVHLIYRGEKRK